MAHQIINTGTTDLKYFCLSTEEPGEICEYPDSDKIGAFAGPKGPGRLHKLFKAGDAVPYLEGECP